VTSRTRLLMCLLYGGLWLASPGLALAGPNEGGTLILHANPSLAFTIDIQDYCGLAALDSCSAAVTSVPWDLEKRVVFHVLAAFPPGSQPRLRGLAFGIDFDSTKFILAGHKTCADFEIPNGGWPGPGSGTGQSWTTATQTGLLTECYWFVGYNYSATYAADSTTFSLIPHPLQGGVFVDDAEPAAVDTIAGYGRLGFGMAGTVPCPNGVGDVVWIESSQVVGGTTADGSSDDPGVPDVPEDDLVGSRLSPMLSLWIDPSAIAFDSTRIGAMPLNELPNLAPSIRGALETCGARNISKMFYGFEPGDTVRVTPQGRQVRVPDLSGYFKVEFPDVIGAQTCASLLRNQANVSRISVLSEPLVASVPTDPYFSTFPVGDPMCGSQADCSRNPEWAIIQPAGPGRAQTGPACAPPVPAIDINVPDDWPIYWTNGFYGPAIIGSIDTGIVETDPGPHPDLHVVPIDDPTLRQLLVTHLSVDWCATHGTKMGGVAAAAANGLGVVGACSDCYLLDIESANCDLPPCLAHDDNACGGLVSDWFKKVPIAANAYSAQDMPVINIEAGDFPDQLPGLEQVQALWRAYISGYVLTAPHGNYPETRPKSVFPAALPFVLGVGGLTHDGRFWGPNTTCLLTADQTTPGPNIDLCAPASPGYVTTNPTDGPGVGDRYYWTRGMCSGATALVAGIVGQFNVLYHFADWESKNGQRDLPVVWPTPDDLVGVLQSTVIPWDPSPLSYPDNTCSTCSPRDFGPGRVNFAAAEDLFRLLYLDQGSFYFQEQRSVGWYDTGVRIDSTTFTLGVLGTYREYTVTKNTVYIPRNNLGLAPDRIGWINRSLGTISNETPTSLMSFGMSTDAARTLSILAARGNPPVTDGFMAPIDSTTGLTTVIGHNFSQVTVDGQGVEHVDYFVERADFKIVYTVVYQNDPASVEDGQQRASGAVASLLEVPNPSSCGGRVSYSLARAGHVCLRLMDAQGREAMRIVDARQTAGRHDVRMTSTDATVFPASGIYWVVLEVDGTRSTRKVVILK
jgi:hypothetical protein